MRESWKIQAVAGWASACLSDVALGLHGHGYVWLVLDGVVLFFTAAVAFYDRGAQ